MALFSRKNINRLNRIKLTSGDIQGRLKNIPMGIVVRMLEEQVDQGNHLDIKIFQRFIDAQLELGGFDWKNTEAGEEFWGRVLLFKEFNLFFKKYPEYIKRDSI